MTIKAILDCILVGEVVIFRFKETAIHVQFLKIQEAAICKPSLQKMSSGNGRVGP
jgi:hypothetical protein